MERPEDVANVIGFLVSLRSEYMTRQARSVDGGLIMHGRSVLLPNGGITGSALEKFMRSAPSRFRW